jgi:hypothetical protein
MVFEPFIFTPVGAFSSLYSTIRPVPVEASEHWKEPGGKKVPMPTIRVLHKRSVCSTTKKANHPPIPAFFGWPTLFSSMKPRVYICVKRCCPLLKMLLTSVTSVKGQSAL